MLSELQSGLNKLKKVDTKQKEAPKMVICADSEDYSRLMKEAYFEEYYESIKTFTFRTEFQFLSKAEAKLLTQAHQAYLKDSNSISASLAAELMQNIIKNIDAKQKELNTRIFVRLSSRSPKDAALLVPSFPTLFNQELAAIKDKDQRNGNKNTDHNQRLHALYIASTKAMSCANGHEAVELLIKSKRIQGDLETYADSADNATNNEPFNLIIREFVAFDVQYEFRAFVYNKKLTGLTQYNEFVHFPDLDKEKNDIHNIIAKFTEETLVPHIKLINCVVDFVLVNENGKLKPYVIELNPFAEFAGGGLFNWVDDMDVLLGRKPFEFRIGKEISAFALQNISTEWQPFVFVEEKPI